MVTGSPHQLCSVPSFFHHHRTPEPHTPLPPFFFVFFLKTIPEMAWLLQYAALQRPQIKRRGHPRRQGARQDALHQRPGSRRRQRGGVPGEGAAEAGWGCFEEISEVCDDVFDAILWRGFGRKEMGVHEVDYMLYDLIILFLHNAISFLPVSRIGNVIS